MSIYVVAGATGRTGSVVASELLAQGKRVRVLVRDAKKGEVWSARGADVTVGSLGDRALLARALRGAAGFYALLPEDPSATDVHGSRRRIADAIAGAVSDSGVPHVVVLSAIVAYLPEGNGPAADLHYFEQALRKAGATLTVLRACGFQENIAGAIPAAKQAGIYPCLLPAGVAAPMVATRDVGQLAARALVQPATSEVIDLIGPTYSATDVAEKVGAALGKKLQVIDVPPAGQVPLLTEAGYSRPFAEAVAELFACLGSGCVQPNGDRVVACSTPIDAVLPALL